MCTGREKLTPESVEFEGQLQYVSDAVLAFANAFKYVPTLNTIKSTLLLLLQRETTQKKGLDLYQRANNSQSRDYY
jgi:hypothetical protein